jgi:hypothetical protein
MLPMKMPALPSFAPATQEQVMPLAAKIILGGLICLIEGLIASAAFNLPHEVGLYYGYLLISFTVWLAMLRFQNTRLGVDVGELCLYEILGASLALMYYQHGKSTEAFWYCFTTIAFLKLIRVYAHFGTTTADHGWGVFGLMTYFRNKKDPGDEDANTRYNMAIALLMAIVMSVIAAFITKELTDGQREMLPWGLALTYIIINGPLLLQAIANLISTNFISKKREAELIANVAQLKQVNTEIAAPNGDIPPEELAEFCASWRKATPAIRTHMVNYIKTLAEEYPTKQESDGQTISLK